MTDSRAALDMDRLPWLTDERKPAPAKPRSMSWAAIVPWSLLAIVLVAGVSYWLGMRSMTERDTVADSRPSVATATLPEPTTEPVERVEPAPMPEVRPVAEPAPVRIEPARTVRKTAHARSVAAKPSSKPIKSDKDSDAEAVRKLEYWPAIESTGANGRMARIGTYSTRRQAKKAWWAIVRHYPGMRSLKAVVAPVPSLRNGRTYYRLQFGTTSQAHSAILCQRMRMIGQSCVVVGAPEKQEKAAEAKEAAAE